MNGKYILQLIFTGVILVFLANLIYLPGPSILYEISQLLYNGFTLFSISELVFLAIGLILLLIALFLKKNVKIPLLLTIIPFFLTVNSSFLKEYLREYSRERTIDEANEVLTALSKYKNENSFYPVNLSELLPIYLDEIPQPSIIGINRYSYKKVNDVFELGFTQNVIFNFNYEVVIFNPKGEQVGGGKMPKLYPTSKKNWKYYLYD